MVTSNVQAAGGCGSRRCKNYEEYDGVLQYCNIAYIGKIDEIRNGKSRALRIRRGIATATWLHSARGRPLLKQNRARIIMPGSARGTAVAGCVAAAVVAVATAASPSRAGASDPVPCTAEETCYNTTEWRCVEAPPGVAGAACTLDYGFNTTSTCACSDQGTYATCVNGTYPAPSPGAAAQLLVIGDSISMGYFGTLQHNLRCEAFAFFLFPAALLRCHHLAKAPLPVCLDSLGGLIPLRA
jgi:hypothetical protein